MTPTRRRGRGEGSVTQRHDHPTCPTAVDGVRPEHRCKGRWMATLDLGYVGTKRRRKTAYGASRKEASIKLQQMLSAQNAGTLVVGRVTVETWLRYWLDVVCIERGLKVNTLRSHRSKVEQYLIPHLGAMPLDRLATEHIRAMYAELRRQGLADSTLRQTHAILRRALAVAVRERKASHNVAADIDPPTAAKTKRPGLSMDDATKVLTAAGDDPRWFLALYYALRQGEVLALRWSDVDLDAGLLHVERSLSVKRGGGYAFEIPKTELSRRTLPLLTVVRSRLAVKHAQHIAAGGELGDLVFSRNGQPIHPRADWQAWSNLLKAAGVAHIPLHAARNTAATLLRSVGGSDRDVADILGHASVEMTRHYQGDDIERKRTALLALEAVLSPAGTP